MSDTPIRLDQLLVVGYADALPEGKGPAIVPPIFQFREHPDRFLVPPFSLVGDWLAGHQSIDRAELKSLATSEEISLLDDGREQQARPDYLLWVDDEGHVAYQALIEARDGMHLIKQKHLDAATEALKLGEIDRAEKHAGIALGASEQALEPRSILAACYRQRGDVKALQVIEKSAIGAGHSQEAFSTVADFYADMLPLSCWQSSVEIKKKDFAKINAVTPFAYTVKALKGVTIYSSGPQAEVVAELQGVLIAEKMAKEFVVQTERTDMRVVIADFMRNDSVAIATQAKSSRERIDRAARILSEWFSPALLTGHFATAR